MKHPAVRIAGVFAGLALLCIGVGIYYVFRSDGSGLAAFMLGVFGVMMILESINDD